jgi:hypothetical protein
MKTKTNEADEATPGPWKVLEDDQVRGQYGEWICSCEGGRHRLQKDRANAALIASAPALLAALHSAANALERIEAGLDTDTRSTLRTVKDALKGVL